MLGQEECTLLQLHSGCLDRRRQLIHRLSQKSMHPRAGITLESRFRSHIPCGLGTRIEEIAKDSRHVIARLDAHGYVDPQLIIVQQFMDVNRHTTHTADRTRTRMLHDLVNAIYKHVNDEDIGIIMPDHYHEGRVLVPTPMEKLLMLRDGYITSATDAWTVVGQKLFSKESTQSSESLSLARAFAQEYPFIHLVPDMPLDQVYSRFAELSQEWEYYSKRRAPNLRRADIQKRLSDFLEMEKAEYDGYSQELYNAATSWIASGPQHIAILLCDYWVRDWAELYQCASRDALCSVTYAPILSDGTQSI